MPDNRFLLPSSPRNWSIRSEGRDRLEFSNLYIFIYSNAPHAYKLRARPLDRPSTLLVIQPDVKMPYLGNGKHIAVLEHLRDCDFFHISCHGCLETGRPFDAFLFFRFAIRPSSWKRHRQRGTPPCGGSPILRVPRHCQDRDHVANGRRRRTRPCRELYRSAFSDRWQRTPSYERTSEALRDAVRVLRRKRDVSTIEEASIWMRNSESSCTH